MFTKIRVKAAAAVAAVALAFVGGGAAYAATSQASPGNADTTVYACQGASGSFDYYEFRTPIPHKCFYSGETLQVLPAVELAQGASFPIAVTITGGQTVTGQCVVEPLADQGGKTNSLGLSCTAAPLPSTPPAG